MTPRSLVLSQLDSRRIPCPDKTSIVVCFMAHVEVLFVCPRNGESDTWQRHEETHFKEVTYTNDWLHLQYQIRCKSKHRKAPCLSFASWGLRFSVPLKDTCAHCGKSSASENYSRLFHADVRTQLPSILLFMAIRTCLSLKEQKTMKSKHKKRTTKKHEKKNTQGGGGAGGWKSNQKTALQCSRKETPTNKQV